MAIGVVVLSKFQEQSAIQHHINANLSVNNTVNAIYDFSTWLAIIVIVIAAAIILGLVLRSFGGGATSTV